MEKPHHLVTEQDIHAYIDGELSDERSMVVEQFLVERELPLQQAARYLHNTFDLRVLRSKIYEDRALRNDIQRLLAKRA